MLTQTIEIQVNNPGLIPQVNAVQADSGRTLNCIVSDMAIPAGATAQIYAQKPSGAKVFNTCSVSGRNVTVDLTTQMLAELGRTMCQVQVMQGEEKVTSFDFAINVVKNRVDSAAIESTDEFTALDDALAQANALLEDLANQPVAFTEAANNAYIASGDTVAELFGKIQKLFENVFELTPLKTIPSGADLNDYTDFGCWLVANSTIAAAVENGPITNSGYTLRVMRGATGTNYIVQTALTVQGVSYFRTLLNTTWSDWEQAYSTKDIIPVSNGGTGRTTLAGSTGLLHDLFPIGRGTATYFMVMDAQWANPGYINIANMKTLLGMDNVFELNPTGTINANDDLNDYKEFGCWLCASATTAPTIENSPVQNTGFTLRVMRGAGANMSWLIQEVLDAYGNHYTRAWLNTYWSDWVRLRDSSDTIPIANGGTGATDAATARQNINGIGAVNMTDANIDSLDSPSAWVARGSGDFYLPTVTAKLHGINSSAGGHQSIYGTWVGQFLITYEASPRVLIRSGNSASGVNAWRSGGTRNWIELQTAGLG